MSAQVQRLLGREVRYQVADAKAIDVRVETSPAGKCAKLKTELIDMSQGGVRLRSKTPLVAGDLLTITVSFKGLNGVSKPLIIGGQVCWTTPARNGRCYVGCSIEPAIPQVLLDHLAASRILERRFDERQETSITLPAQWECDPTEVSASILNISDGGMCLLISQMRNVGDRIRLTIFDENDKPAYVHTTVCWQIDTDDGHVLGCDFDDRAAYLRLKQVADLQTAKAATGTPLVGNEPFDVAIAGK
jgi:hypothetical protein